MYERTEILQKVQKVHGTRMSFAKQMRLPHLYEAVDARMSNYLHLWVHAIKD